MDSRDMGKKSWEVRKSPEEMARLKKISAIGVNARQLKKALKIGQAHTDIVSAIDN